MLTSFYPFRTTLLQLVFFDRVTLSFFLPACKANTLKIYSSEVCCALYSCMEYLLLKSSSMPNTDPIECWSLLTLNVKLLL